MKLGFVGIGRMGEPIVFRLLNAGFRVTAWNRNQEKLSKVVASGATPAGDLKQVAADSDAIFTMVTDDAAVDEIYRGSDGLLSCPDVRGKLFVDMSTILPDTVKRIAASVFERSASFVDAPVAGTVQPAREGHLLVFAGGNARDVEKLKPAFDAMARRVQHMGPLGSGAAMKLVHNALLTTYWSVLAEATAIGTQYGLDFKRMLETIVESPAALAALPIKVPALLGQPAEIGFNIANVQKDLRTIARFAGETAVAAPILDAVRNAFDEAVNAGLSLEDVAAIVKRAASRR